MLQEQRFDLILQFLRETGSLSVHELVRRLGVSRETVRRDLKDMQDKGLLTKVHGGAVLNKVGDEPSYAVRTATNREEKVAIAEAALGLVEDGDTLFMDSGTTTLELAHLLHNRRNLTVLTHSLPVAIALVERGVKVYISGGLLRPDELALSGVIANQVAGNFYVDKAFIGPDGISLHHGLTAFHVEESELRRTILTKANTVIVLADHSKFGATAFTQFASIAEMD